MKMKLDKDIVYDVLVPALCPSYDKALREFSRRAAYAKSIVELGIGTGNIACAVLKRNPSASYRGYDTSDEALEKARHKLRAYGDVSLDNADFAQISLPRSDIVISSLSVHHLSHEGQADLFARIQSSCDQFLHFELVAPGSDAERKRNEAYISECARDISKRLDISFEAIEKILEGSKQHDHPIPLGQHIMLHESYGALVDILWEDHGFVMYHTHKK